jgi:hypothetical protein
MKVTIRRFQCNYLGHILRMSEMKYPRIMLHAEIALGKQKSGVKKFYIVHVLGKVWNCFLLISVRVLWHYSLWLRIEQCGKMQ